MTQEITFKQGAVETSITGLAGAKDGAVVTALPRGWVGARRQPLVVAFLISLDVLLALLVWLLASAVQSVWGHGELSDITSASLAPYVAAWLGLRAMVGLYPGYGLGEAEELRRQTFALLGTLSITTAFAVASQTGDYLSRLQLFTWLLGLLLLAPVMRTLAKRTAMRVGLWGKPVVVFGAQKTGAQMLRLLQREWRLGLHPVGVFDDRCPPEDVIYGVPYGGKLSEASILARERRVDTAIFAMPHTRREHLLKHVDRARLSYRHIVVIPNLEGITNSAVVARDLAGTFGVEIQYNLLNPWAQRVKRALDVGATVVGGLFVLPLLLVLAALVWLESGGAVFYKDLRIGRDGKLFPCVKFRTMVPDSEELLHRMLEEDPVAREEYMKYHKLREDPRVTRVGRFLRKTSLDELPQLWNVVRGQMSLVGPRPYLPRESGEIGETQSEIMRVTPGITGPWQVSGRNHTSFSERVRIDAGYVRDWSVWMDLVILSRTFQCLVFSRDAY